MKKYVNNTKYVGLIATFILCMPTNKNNLILFPVLCMGLLFITIVSNRTVIKNSFYVSGLIYSMLIGNMFYQRWAYSSRISNYLSIVHLNSKYTMIVVTIILCILSVLWFQSLLISYCSFSHSKIMTEAPVSRKEVEIIKGIALICMLFHHFFTFPSWHAEVIQYNYLDEIAYILNQPTRICVPIFAFITGMLFPFYKDKSFRYLLKKIVRFWISYLSVFFVFMLFALANGNYRFSFVGFLLELFSLKSGVMVFCWYVPFWIVTMMLLPFVEKIYIRRIDIVVALFLSLLVLSGLINQGKLAASMIYVDFLKGFIDFFPVVLAGYIGAKAGCLEFMLLKIENTRSIIAIIFSAFAILISFMGRYYSLRTSFYSVTLDIVYAPLFILGVCGIYRKIKIQYFNDFFAAIGKYSMFMWFCHGIFFGDCGSFTKPILYYLKNPLLVLVWGGTIVYIMARGFDYITRRLLSVCGGRR